MEPIDWICGVGGFFYCLVKWINIAILLPCSILHLIFDHLSVNALFEFMCGSL